MNISMEEYRRLRDIEDRYNEIIKRTLANAKVDKEHPGELYFTGGAVRYNIVKFFTEEYERRKREVYGD